MGLAAREILYCYVFEQQQCVIPDEAVLFVNLYTLSSLQFESYVSALPAEGTSVFERIALRLHALMALSLYSLARRCGPTLTEAACARARNGQGGDACTEGLSEQDRRCAREGLPAERSAAAQLRSDPSRR